MTSKGSTGAEEDPWDNRTSSFRRLVDRWFLAREDPHPILQARRHRKTAVFVYARPGPQPIHTESGTKNKLALAYVELSTRE